MPQPLVFTLPVLRYSGQHVPGVRVHNDQVQCTCKFRFSFAIRTFKGSSKIIHLVTNLHKALNSPNNLENLPVMNTSWRWLSTATVCFLTGSRYIWEKRKLLRINVHKTIDFFHEQVFFTATFSVNRHGHLSFSDWISCTLVETCSSAFQ